MKIRTIPYGYKWVCGEYKINQEEKEIIQLIIELYLSDNSMKKIADTLNVKGIKYDTDAVWNKSKIMRVLDDKRYIGNELYPQIISTVEYKNIQIKRNQRNSMNVNERIAHIKLSVHSLCSVCQLPLEYRYRGNCKKQHRWICHNCNTVVEIKEDELEGQIIKQLKRIKEDIYLLKQENKMALTTDAIKAKNTVINSLYHSDFDKETLTNQMLLCASKIYALQSAIMRAISESATENIEVLDVLKQHIAMGLMVEEDIIDKSLEYQIRLKDLNKQYNELLGKIKFGDENTSNIEQMLEQVIKDKREIQNKLDQYKKKQESINKAKSRLDEIYDVIDILKNHPMSYDDNVVRQVIDYIKIVDKNSIHIKFKNGKTVINKITNDNVI